MKLVICDDDPAVINELKQMLIHFFRMKDLELPEINTFRSADEMLRTPCSYDLAFLDVEMPGISGLVASRELKKRNPRIMVFIITGFSDTYLDESFDEGVYRYLTKPISEKRLTMGLRSALIRLASPNKTLIIQTKDGSHPIMTEDILMVCTSLRNTEIITTTGSLTCTLPLSYWRTKLPTESFFETHKGYLVNLKHIRCFDKEHIYMDDHVSSAYLSKRKYSEFKKRYLLYLENE